MSTDIRLSVDFLAHHKTLKLKRKLGNEAVLALIGLFCYAGKFRSGGALEGLDAEDIADASGWAGGDAQGYVSTLCEVGFLEQCEEGVYAVHDWATHQPWVAGAEDRKAAASKAGKASAEARKKDSNIKQVSTEFNGALAPVERVLNEPFNGPSTPSPLPLPSPSPKGLKSNPPVPTKVGTSPPRGEPPYTKAFLTWWEAYPVKVKKPRAWKAWVKLGKSVDAVTLIKAVAAQLEAEHFMVGTENCVPHPSTWLNDRRWEDEIKAREKTAQDKLAAWAARPERESKKPQSPAERLLAKNAVDTKQG